MSLNLPHISVDADDPEASRIVATHCLREAAEHIQIGNMQQAKTLTEAALIWLEGYA